MKDSKLKIYKRFELRMFWVHFDSVEPKVLHVLCHCYAAINIFIKIFKVLIFFLTAMTAVTKEMKTTFGALLSRDGITALHLKTQIT